ncbi:MAG: hypothetical protein MUF56_02140 [Solirubrobacteraceae bacterium]|jgi:catechol 2,3-dioxygenase-like lactoylglutathione lyase family enzyme|nr:hypothetical protein [Solirubrobacteraceae bacterium]
MTEPRRRSWAEPFKIKMVEPLIFCSPFRVHTSASGARCCVSTWRRPDGNALPSRAEFSGAYVHSVLANRVPAAEPRRPELSAGGTLHLSLGVADLDAVLAALGGSEAHVISRRPVLFEEPGSPWDGVRCAYVADPDGVVLELVQRAEALG